MGARHSQQKARSTELDITDIASNKQPPAAAALTASSATHTAVSSATTSPALTSLSSKLAQQAWAPQQSRYIQQDSRAEDQVTEWKPDDEEKEEDDISTQGKSHAGEDLFGKYRGAAAAGGSNGSGAVLGKRSAIVSSVKAASSVERRQPSRVAAPGMTAPLEDDDGVDDSAVSTRNTPSPIPSLYHIANVLSSALRVAMSAELPSQGCCAFPYCARRRRWQAAAAYARRCRPQLDGNRLLSHIAIRRPHPSTHCSTNKPKYLSL